jgi:hypothetical protein
MALSGQASGGWTESSSALRLLHVGIRNTVGVLTADGFTMTNPTNVANTNNSAGFDSSILGVLSGSVAFTRGDIGPNEIGGAAVAAGTAGVTEIGVFINTAAGNDFENQPAVASDKCPYVSSQGTYANSLYETNDTQGTNNALTYTAGDQLFASANGYLTNDAAAGRFNGANGVLMGILKMPADAVQPEIVYDQRI